jgi:hypothetical protein
VKARIELTERTILCERAAQDLSEGVDGILATAADDSRPALDRLKAMNEAAKTTLAATQLPGPPGLTPQDLAHSVEQQMTVLDELKPTQRIGNVSESIAEWGKAADECLVRTADTIGRLARTVENVEELRTRSDLEVVQDVTSYLTPVRTIW